MKFVIAPDSYKGCLSAQKVAEAIKRGIQNVLPNSEFTLMPLADGGEGTLKTMLRVEHAKAIYIETHDAFMRQITAEIVKLPDNVFLVELAEICGIERHKNELNALKATTFGVGKAIIEATRLGAKEIIVALGGSCSTDAGAGIAQALGVKFFTRDGEQIPDGIGGGELGTIAGFSMENLKITKLTIASDVTAPLFGANGAAKVFAGQKGASSDEIELLETNLRHFAEILHDSASSPGDGAAGGAGFALRFFAGGKNVSGGNLIMEKSGFHTALRHADYMITGEGRSDIQTLAGKLCSKAAQTAHAAGVPAILISGAIADVEKITGEFDTLIAVSPPGIPLDEAIRNAEIYIEKSAQKFANSLIS